MRYLLFVCTLFMVLHSRACDVCGGVSSNASIGLFANTRFHIIGFQSGFRSFDTYLHEIKHSREQMFSTDFRFRIQLHRRIQLLGIAPYQIAIQQTDFGSNKVHGLGDISLMSNFIVLNKRDTNGLSRHFLSLAVGLKSASGKNTIDTDPLKNIYPGTGSWDLLLLTNYTHQFDRKWGWQNEASVSIKGKDRYGYSFGNSYQLTSQAVVNLPLSRYRLISAIGFNGEYHEASKLEGARTLIPNLNKGFVCSARGAINLMGNSWLLSAYLQQPIVQNFNEGLTKQRLSCGISINYLINK